jgi:uncharacterized membrane protein YraQ (UPF0718 family)
MWILARRFRAKGMQVGHHIAFALGFAVLGIAAAGVTFAALALTPTQ